MHYNGNIVGYGWNSIILTGSLEAPGQNKRFKCSSMRYGFIYLFPIFLWRGQCQVSALPLT